MDVFCHCIDNTCARVGWDDPGLRFNLQGGRGWGSGTEAGGRGWEALLACVRSHLLSARGAGGALSLICADGRGANCPSTSRRTPARRATASGHARMLGPTRPRTPPHVTLPGLRLRLA